jgi:subtilisin family serine protease
MLSFEEIIARYYIGYYNRAPDPEGFDFWVNAYANGVSTLEIATFFSDQPETRVLYPYFSAPARNSPEQFITSIYNNLFNREPDAAGLAFWIEALTSGNVNIGQMIEEIIGGARTNPDLAVVQNKVASALYWEDQANNFSGFPYDATAAAAAAAALSGVTDDLASVVSSRDESNVYFASLDLEKGYLGGGFTDDGSENDKVGIATSARGDHGAVSVLSVQSGSVINMENFRNDLRFADIDGRGQTVVVIDTGMDLDNPAFGPDSNNDGIADRIIFSRDFTSEGDGTANDVEGHGTHVASIIGSSSNNTLGVAPGVNFVALQALDATGSGTVAGIEDALQWVVQNAEAMNIVAVNMSLGDGSNFNFSRSHPAYGDELRILHDNLNVTVVAAAGNDYDFYQAEGASSLAVDPHAIAIGAVGGTLATGSEVAFFSQRSDDIPTFFAPGQAVIGAAPGGGTSASSGTSQAAPHVAGMIALAQQLAQRELGRSLTPDEMFSLLTQSSRSFVDDENLDDRVVNTGSTYLRVDAFNFGEAVLALSQTGAPAPTPGPTPTPNPTPVDNIDGSISTDAVISVNSTRTSTIDFDGDLDYFKISLTPGEYEFSLRASSSGAGSLSDPLLTVLSSTGAFISSDDDSGAGLDSLLSFTVTSPAMFFLGAGAFGSATGSYELGVTQLSSESGDVGDAIGTAGRLDVGETTTSEINFGGDRDWFAIHLFNGTRYTFDLVGNTLSDPYLALYNENGTVVAANDDGGEGLNAHLEFVANRTGMFYLSAEGFSPSQTGSYSLSAAQVSSADDDFAEGPNTTGAIDAVAGAITGRLETTGDRDWFLVDLVAGSTYEFQLRGTHSGQGLSDPFLHLFDAGGNVVGSNDDSSEGLDSLLTFNAQSGGSYFLVAGAYGDNGTGDYILSSARVAEGQNDVPGNPSTTATLAVGQTISGAIDGPGDFDWYGVNTVAGQVYQFSLVSAGDAPMSDPWLTLYDGAGNFIDFNDDGPSGTDSYLEYVAVTGGRVFISAEAYDLATDVGTYELGLTSPEVRPSDIPGNQSTQATLSPGQVAVGVIDGPGDVDWFRVQLDDGRTYEFSMNSAGSDPMDDAWLSLYDGSGSLITFDDDSGGGRNSLLQYQAVGNETVYLAAEAYDPNFDAGTYEVGVSISGSGPVGDTPSDPSTPASLTLDQIANGLIDVPGDTDWFWANLAGGQTYLFIMTATGTPNSLADPYLVLYDSSGNSIAEDDDSFGNLNAMIEFTPSSDQHVYISAEAFDSSADSGSYTIGLVATLPSFSEFELGHG